MGRIFGNAQVEILAFQFGGGLLERGRERTGRDHQADLAAVDHGFHVVELVGLQAAEDHQLGGQAIAKLHVELLGLVFAQGHAIHARGHDHARRIQAAGRKGLVDVDLGHLLGELVGQLGQAIGQLGQVGRLGLPEHALDVVLPRVFQHDHAARARRSGSPWPLRP